MTKFRILHISDPHFCVEPNRKNRIALWREGKQNTLEGFGYTAFRTLKIRNKKDPEPEKDVLLAQRYFSDFFFSSYRPMVAEQVARFAHFNRNKFDLIICTGDLATTGLASDLKQAFNYFVHDPQWGAFLSQKVYDPLNSIGRPLVLMPGNHDRYRDGTGAAGGRTFDLVFGQFWPTGQKLRVSWEVLQQSDDHLGIIAADFSLLTNADVEDSGQRKLNKVLGQGKCHTNVLNELENTTRELRDLYPNLVIVWAVHFPPVGIDPDDDLALRECVLLKNSATKLNVRVLLAGHLHKKLEHELGLGRMLGAGSFCAVDFEGNHWIHLIELDARSGELVGLSREDYKFSINERMFVKDGRQEFFLAS